VFEFARKGSPSSAVSTAARYLQPHYGCGLLDKPLDRPESGRDRNGEVVADRGHRSGLIADCRALLDEKSKFLVLTVYAIRMSALAIGELVARAMADLGGVVEVGEMAVREEARGLLLPTAIFARWSPS